MVTYLPPVPPKKNIWGRLGAAAGEGLEKGAEEARKAQMAQQLQGQKREANIAMLEREYQLKSDIESEKRQSKIDELSGKKRENLAPLQAGLSTLKQMREIGDRGHLGRGSSFKSMFGGQAAKDFGEYQQLGKSLISLASNIPIRNQREFETLAHELYDPTIPDYKREGILDAMERIITQNMQQYETPEMGRSTAEEEEGEEEREFREPDIDIVRNLYKQSGGDLKKAQRMAEKMGIRI